MLSSCYSLRWPRVSGYLGLNAFHHILSDARTQGIPLILETPSFEQPKQVWGKEIQILHEVSGIAAEFSVNGIQRGLDFVDLTDQIKSAVKEAEKRSGRAKGKKTASRKTKGTETPEEDAEEEGEKEENWPFYNLYESCFDLLHF